MQPKTKSVLLVLGILWVIISAVVAFVYISDAQTSQTIIKPPINTEPRDCTQEAKICPDGSAVGRTGPNCEFAPCPVGKTLPPIPESDQSNY